VTNDTQNHVDFESLLEFLKQSRGFDFTGYKRSSLMRRVSKRLTWAGCASYGEYLDYLQVHPDEFVLLFNTILINVTGFFRDTSPWEELAQDVLPNMLKEKRPSDPIRVWSAGCASGEEAYTIAILMGEILGLSEFRERVKIYATDVDEEALATARHAAYSAKELESVPPHLTEKYFESGNGGRYVFRPELRRTVIFGRHDLVQDAPISRLDLLVCRNTLMYFNAETQSRILARFHFALNSTGVLFLGRAEMLLTHAHLFSPLNLKNRIFVKADDGLEMRDRLLGMAPMPEQPTGRIQRSMRLRDLAFDASPMAQLVVDLDGNLLMANDRARQSFDIHAGDLGRPLRDLEISYRPVDLRSPMERVLSSRSPLMLPEVERHRPEGDNQILKVYIVPLLQNGGVTGVSVLFEDVTALKKLQADLERSSTELETAYEELQSTNEELETTNEELQSTVEELETTNEELQSTNEELETMNEELQSTNEELETMNDELRLRTEELNNANAYLHSILGSLHSGVVVMDGQMQVQVWSERAEDLWGLRAHEVRGKSFLGLDIGFPVDQLKPTLKACIAGEGYESETTLEAVNRRGRAIRCRVTCAPLTNQDGAREGAVLLMDEA
jgi:two-component system CheB/CheR fusion protein